jgi:hypothetical protein
MKDFSSELYLVCKLVRRGKLDIEKDPKKQKVVQGKQVKSIYLLSESWLEFRRPYGCALTCLKDWTPNKKSEISMQFYYCKDENLFYNIQECMKLQYCIEFTGCSDTLQVT